MKRIINLLIGTILIVTGVILYLLAFILTPFIKAHKYLTKPKLTPKQVSELLQPGIKAIFDQQFKDMPPIDSFEDRNSRPVILRSKYSEYDGCEIKTGRYVKAPNFDQPMFVVRIDEFGTATMVYNLDEPDPKTYIQVHVSRLQLIKDKEQSQ